MKFACRKCGYRVDLAHNGLSETRFTNRLLVALWWCFRHRGPWVIDQYCYCDEEVPA